MNMWIIKTQFKNIANYCGSKIKPMLIKVYLFIFALVHFSYNYHVDWTKYKCAYTNGIIYSILYVFNVIAYYIVFWNNNLLLFCSTFISLMLLVNHYMVHGGVKFRHSTRSVSKFWRVRGERSVLTVRFLCLLWYAGEKNFLYSRSIIIWI